MKPGNYWVAWVVFALGVWELFAPFIWKYGSHFTMTANACGFGVLIMMFGFWVVATDHEWASWVCVGLGAWLVVSGLALEHSLTKALVNDVVVGVLTIGAGYLAARHGKAAWKKGWPTIERGAGHLSG